MRYFGIRSPSFHQLDEPLEQVVRVVRPWRGLGVVLHGEDRQLPMPHALGGAVVEVHVGFDEPGLLHRPGIHAEAVVLRGDLDAPGLEVLHGMVGAVVAELELVGAAPEGQAQDLVAEADAEDRQLADELAHRFHEVRHGFGIAGAIGEKEPVGLSLEDGRGRSARGHHLALAAERGKLAQDVSLDPRVIGHDPEARGGRPRVAAGDVPAALRPAVGRLHRDLADEIATDEARERAGPVGQSRGVDLDRGDHAFLGAVIAQKPRERARVDALDPHDALLAHEIFDGDASAPVGGIRAGLFHDEAVDPGPLRLDVFRIDAVVPDEGVRHAHDLPAVGRIGHDLLIARHRRVEADLAVRLARRAAGLAREDATIRQGQQRARHGETTLPPTMVMTGAPVPVEPAKGVLRARERNLAGSTVHGRSRSSIVMSAGAPAARLPPGRFRSRAGAGESRWTSVGRSIRPPRTSRSSRRGTAVSSPTTPLAQAPNSSSFSERACGAWSVAMQSTVPSRRPSSTASISRLVRSGGAIFMLGSYSRTASSVSRRWCGVASAVTRTPRALASRTRRTAPTVETWAMCTCAPVSSASRMSRATMTSSAAEGWPARPSSVETSPSCMAPRWARCSSSAWLMMGVPKGRVYSMARR